MESNGRNARLQTQLYFLCLISAWQTELNTQSARKRIRELKAQLSPFLGVNILVKRALKGDSDADT